MEIYYEKIKIKVKVIRFFARLLMLIGVAGGVLFALQYFEIIQYYLTYHQLIKIASLSIIGISIFMFLLSIVMNKRDNVRFDGQVVKFYENFKELHEFDLRKIDEIFNYRSNKEIPYGYQNSIAFRFHKNEVWETINDDLYNKKTKKSSVQLIRDINEAYAKIKTERALSEMTSEQGIRFRYLGINKSEGKEEINNHLVEFEKTFKNYTNAYGEFELNRLVITNDSIYLNKEKIASINNGDYAKERELQNYNIKYLNSSVIDIFDKNDKIITSIDLTLVINAQLFKSLCLSVFAKI